MKWYTDLGLASERLILREHTPEELAHYSIATADVEYSFPFLPEGADGRDFFAAGSLAALHEERSRKT